MKKKIFYILNRVILRSFNGAAVPLKRKIENAIDALASGVIIFNEGNEGRTELIHSRIDTSKPGFPVIGMSFFGSRCIA